MIDVNKRRQCLWALLSHYRCSISVFDLLHYLNSRFRELQRSHRLRLSAQLLFSLASAHAAAACESYGLFSDCCRRELSSQTKTNPAEREEANLTQRIADAEGQSKAEGTKCRAAPTTWADLWTVQCGPIIKRPELQNLSRHITYVTHHGTGAGGGDVGGARTGAGVRVTRAWMAAEMTPRSPWEKVTGNGARRRVTGWQVGRTDLWAVE
jgi:hypothetical protein